MAHPGYTINIHLNDDVEVKAHRVPSGDTDFVSFTIGSQSSVFVMNTDQARALIDAAEDAFYILRTIEDEKARAERARARETAPVYSYDEIEDETNWDSECSDSNPCPACQEYEDSIDQYEDYESQF